MEQYPRLQTPGGRRGRVHAIDATYDDPRLTTGGLRGWDVHLLICTQVGAVGGPRDGLGSWPKIIMMLLIKKGLETQGFLRDLDGNLALGQGDSNCDTVA